MPIVSPARPRAKPSRAEGLAGEITTPRHSLCPRPSINGRGFVQRLLFPISRLFATFFPATWTQFCKNVFGARMHLVRMK